MSACSPDGAANRAADEPASPPDQAAVAPPAPVTSQSPAPAAPPTRWVGLIGEYGPDDDVWLILEDESRLHLRQGEVAHPLEELSPDEFLGRPSEVTPEVDPKVMGFPRYF